MTHKLLAILLSVATATPALAGPTRVVPNGGVTAVGENAGSASVGGIGVAPLVTPNAADLSAGLSGVLPNADALAAYPTEQLAAGLGQRLPQIADLVQQVNAAQDPTQAQEAAARLSSHLADNLKGNDESGKAVRVADAALLAALNSDDPQAALAALAKRLAGHREVADGLQALGKIGTPALRQVMGHLNAFGAELKSAIESGSVSSLLAQKIDQGSGQVALGEETGGVTRVGDPGRLVSAAARGLKPAASETPLTRAFDGSRTRATGDAAAVPAPASAPRLQPAGRAPVVIGGRQTQLDASSSGDLLAVASNLNLAVLDGKAEREALETRDAPAEETGASLPVPARGGRLPLTSRPMAKPELQPDFVDVGMGPTGMMAMIGAIASGRTAVGVEIRGNPTRGVHQNIREEWFHELGLIDEMMIKRYGIDGIPKMPNGKPFLLADFFYNAKRKGGNLDFDEIWGKFDEDGNPIQNLAGRLQEIVFIDAREETLAANGGKEKAYVLPPPAIPEKADPSKITGNIRQVLDSPSVFQVALINYELMLRKYLHLMEEQDKAAGRKPRVKIYENHRVVQEFGTSAGYVPQDPKGSELIPRDDGSFLGPDGRPVPPEQVRRRIVIEEIVDERGGGDGAAKRVRKPGTLPIDLGTPVRFALTAGFGGGLDAKTLGYKQKDVVYQDAASGEPIAAKQHWIAVEVTANTGGKLIRRVATAIDPKTGDRHTVRQINVGHENTPNVTWVPVQIPDFMEFDPIAAGKVPAGTPTGSKEYRAAAQKLLYDYTVSQIAAVTYRPEADIRRMRMFYGPNAFTLQEKIGESARVASNGTVAGDLMGNGHFLTSGGAMTGMIGHTLCFLRYWDNLAKGVPQDVAAKILEEGIKAGSEAWLHVSQKEFSNLAPANFGKARSEALGIKESAPAAQAVQRPGFSLSSVLGNGRWEQSFQRLLAGEFGKPGVNFYVPDSEVDIRAQPNVTVQAVPVR